MKRQSGVLLPIFSLPGAYGCGTMGSDALRWINFLAQSGFSWWQVLPVGMTDSGNLTVAKKLIEKSVAKQQLFLFFFIFPLA